MEFILGMVVALVFMLCLLFVYEAGKRRSNPPTKEQPKASEEDLRRTKKIHEDFQRLMSYDVETAIDRKKEDYGGEE